MSLWFDVTRIATVINIILLLGLSYVWVRNHLRLRTKFTVGFLAFGGFLLADNAFAFYIYVLNPTTSGWFAGIPERYNVVIMLLALFQLGALLALAWVTFEFE
jgi:NADH:ubiquinone oxidoreductase subunit 3 (subunit A)